MQELSQIRLKYFFETFCQKSIRGAAETLNVSPSLISRQIQLLEKEIGFILFERYKNKLIPTEVAFLLEEYYRKNLSSQRDLGVKLAELKGDYSGNVNICISEGIADVFLKTIINPFLKDHTDIKIDIKIESVDFITNAVLSDTVDFGICLNPAPNIELNIIKNNEQFIGLAVAKNHPLALLGNPVTLEECLYYSHGVMATGHGLRKYIDNIEFQYDIVFKKVISTNSLIILKEFILGGGVALMPSSNFPQEAKHNEIIILKIKDISMPSSSFCLITRKGRYLSSASMKIFNITKNMLLG